MKPENDIFRYFVLFVRMTYEDIREAMFTYYGLIFDDYVLIVQTLLYNI